MTAITTLRTFLLIVTGFTLVSVLGVGFGLMLPESLGVHGFGLNGMGVALAQVGGLLVVTIGGSQLLAFFFLQGRRFCERTQLAYVVAIVAGLGTVAWVNVEDALLNAYSILHTVYMAAGIAQVGLAIACLVVLSKASAAVDDIPAGRVGAGALRRVEEPADGMNEWAGLRQR